MDGFTIDKVGYGKAMVFAFACHVTFAFMTIFGGGQMNAQSIRVSRLPDED